MAAKSGYDWKLSLGTATYLGGKVLDAEPSIEGTSFSEPGTGTRTLATAPLQASALPRLRWTMNIQRLVDYINAKAIITAEGVVPAHTIYTTDGQTAHDLTSAKVNSCEIRVNRGESIKAILEVIGKTWGTTGYQSGSERAEVPVDFTDITVSIGTGITNFRSMGFTVNNNVGAEYLGTTVTPSEVYERQAAYSGFVERSINATDHFADVQSGTPTDVVYVITDHQGTPVAKTYTFSDCLLRVSRKPVRALDLIIERIEWEGAVLAITP